MCMTASLAPEQEHTCEQNNKYSVYIFTGLFRRVQANTDLLDSGNKGLKTVQLPERAFTRPQAGCRALSQRAGSGRDALRGGFNSGR